MEEKSPCNPKVMELLEEKSSTKQKVFRKTKDIFRELKLQLSQLANSFDNSICGIDDSVRVSYKDKSAYESEIHFSGDILLFNMHTNVFAFEKSNPIWKTGYVLEDKRRAYFGMINIYNFLADSFRFNRQSDVGVLLGRIFINHEGHFFVEGRRQLGFLYRDLAKNEMDSEDLKSIIETAMIYALEYDLTVPEFKDSMLVSVNQVQTLSNEFHLKTSKKLGFRFHTKINKIE